MRLTDDRDDAFPRVVGALGIAGFLGACAAHSARFLDRDATLCLSLAGLALLSLSIARLGMR